MMQFCGITKTDEAVFRVLSSILKLIAFACLLAASAVVAKPEPLKITVPKCKVTTEEVEVGESCIPKADKVCEDKEIEVIVKVEPDCNKLGYCVPKPVKETKTVPACR